jgi:hypothetical protein
VTDNPSVCERCSFAPGQITCSRCGMHACNAYELLVAKIDTLPALQYDARTDRVVYGSATEGFGATDWLRVAWACVDQGLLHAEASRDVLETVQKVLKTVTGDLEADEDLEEEEGSSPVSDWLGAIPAPPTKVPCPSCTTDPSRNFPRGMVFVGSGCGWAACPRCNGTGFVADTHDGEVAAVREAASASYPPRPPPRRWGP